MKMVKSLLLGSAAGLVAVAGAQAADLPVKAKPVEYVKVCSLYGAGYYYMPGTDICIKLGGYTRWQFNYSPGSSISAGPFNGTGGRASRTDMDDTAQRTRAVITVDTRQQTAYGTLRTYVLLGYQQDSTAIEATAPAVYMTRGFIQIAGFTFGKATSFFDIYPNASFAYLAGHNFSGDSGDAGKMLAGYTAQFGNGVSATIAIEQSRRLQTLNLAAGGVTYALGGATTAGTTQLGGASGGLPDLVMNLRVDQVWGMVMVGLALHDASGGYYGAGTTNLGHPSNKLGWAATAGWIFNLPMIAPGDRFSAQFVYSQGATKYHAATPGGANMLSIQGSNVAWGNWEDGVYGGSAVAGLNSVELTTAWSVAAAIEHLWTPALRTSLYGSYIKVTHNANAIALTCTGGVIGGAAASVLSGVLAGATCNPDWSSWTLGTRTQWEPVRGLVMGVDVIYLRLNTALQNNAGITSLTAAQGAFAAGQGYTNNNASTLAAAFRIERQYLP